MESSCPGIAFAPLPGELGTMESWQKWAIKEWVVQNPIMPDARDPAMQPELAPRPKSILTHSELACAHENPPDPPFYQSPIQRFSDGVVDETRGLVHTILCDYKNMYLTANLAYLGLAVGIAAPLAETHADQTMRDWYQNHVRTINTDRFIEFGNNIGFYQYVIPVYAGGWVMGAIFHDNCVGNVVYEWSTRTLRAIAVGAPAVGVLQYGLGPSRPGDGDSSHWHPLHDSHGASGNAFVAAVPFMAAATMVENPFLQAAFMVGSLYGGWARIDLDAHYFSQVFLGWSVAFLSMRSVMMTDSQRHSMDIVPIQVPGPNNTVANGIGVMFHY
jgi:hypothetical protein